MLTRLARFFPTLVAFFLAILLLFLPLFLHNSTPEGTVTAAPLTQGEQPQIEPEPSPEPLPTPEPTPEVKVNLATDQQEVEAGEFVTYTIVLTNTTANTVDNIVLSSTLPPSTTFVPDPNSPITYDPLTGEVIWDAGSIPSNTILTATYQVQADSASTDTLVLAEVIATSPDLTETLASWEVNSIGESIPNEMWITPEGGFLKGENFPINIIVNNDTIEEPLYFQVGATSASNIPNYIWAAFDLTATTKSGEIVTSFPSPITLAADLTGYLNNTTPISGTPAIYWLNEHNGNWELVPSVMNWSQRTVTASIDHFSTFAIGSSNNGSYGVQHLPAMHGIGTDEFSGNSTYSYPFRLPSGPGGFGLNLGLTYSSEGVNSILAGPSYNPAVYDVYMRQASPFGWGWNLTGLGAIVRVNTGEENGGNKVYLNFSGGSYELKVVNPGATPRVWRTNPESFLKIEQHLAANGNGNYLDQAIYWEVTTPDGIRFIFGDPNWSHPSVGFGIDLSGCHKELREVHLSRIIDTHGNTVRIDYQREMDAFGSSQCDSQGNGEDYVRAVRPTAIRYFPAGVDPFSGLDTVRTTLVYTDTRLDTHILNHDAEQVQRLYSDWRLQEVIAEVRDGQTSESYTDSVKYTFNVTYTQEGSSSWGDYENIMLLGAITEHGRDWRNPATGPHTRPPTTFTYDQPGESNGGYGANFLALKGVNNGQGGSTVYVYERVNNIPIAGSCSLSSAMESEMGNPTTRRFRVKKMEVWNGVGDSVTHIYEALNSADQPNPTAAAYAQGNGFGCQDQFEFMGFNRVRHDIEDGNQTPIYRTITEFHQPSPSNGLEPRKGRPYRVRQLHPTTNALYQQSLITWVVSPTGFPEVFWVRKFEERILTNQTSPGNPILVLGITKISQYEYGDEYGNLTEMREYGDNTIRRITTTYVYSPAINLVNRPFESKLWELTSNSGGQPQYTCRQHQQFAYDGNGYGNPPDDGALTHSKIFTQGCNGGAYSESVTEYDGWGNPTKITDALSNSASVEYDTSPTLGWPRLYALPIRESQGNIDTEYEWDTPIGQIVSSLAPNNQATTYLYDEWGRLREVKKPLDSAFTQRFTYYDYFNTTNLPLEQRKPYMVKSEQRTGSNTVTYAYTFYDGLGRELQTITPFYTGSQSTLKWSVTLATYNELGGVAKAYAPIPITPSTETVAGSNNTIPYLENSSSTSTWTGKPFVQNGYDLFGRMTSQTATDGSITQYQYDIEAVAFPEWNDLEVLQYKQTVINANNNSTHYFSDSFGRLRAIEEVSGTETFTTYYNYTIQDQLDVITDSLGHTTRMIFDAAGRKIEMRDPDMGTWYYTYDPAGNLIRQQDSRDQRICYYYDSLNRLTGKEYRNDDNCSPDRPPFAANVIHYNYDGTGTTNNPYALGLRTEMLDGSGSTRWWYDQRGRMTKEEKTVLLDGSTSETFATDYTYDSADRPLTMLYPAHPNGSVRESISYSYGDPLQQWLRSVSSSESGTLASGFAYNSFGQLTTMDVHTNPMVHQVYDYWGLSVYKGAGRLRSVLVNGGDQMGTILQLSYSNDQSNTQPGYDALGNITSIWEKRWQRLPASFAPSNPDAYFFQQQRMEYDALNRLTSYQAVGGPSGSGITAREEYEYNSIGNLVSRQLFDAQPNQVRSYNYTAPSVKPTACPEEAVITPKAHAVYGTSGRVDALYCYDDAGNMVYRADEQYTQTLFYDAENRLVTISGIGASAYVYDGDGNRVKATTNGNVTLYLGMHAEYEVGSGTLRSYFFAGERRLAIRERIQTTLTSGNVVSFLVGDHLGSTSVTVNSNGQVIADLRYTAWGETRCCYGGAAATPTQRRFTGQLEDVGTGLYFYNARFYDPALARFVQADTIVPVAEIPQDWNRYTYTRNNPLFYVDPTGHFSEKQIAEMYGVNDVAEIWWWNNPDYADFQMALLNAEWGDILSIEVDGVVYELMFVVNPRNSGNDGYNSFVLWDVKNARTVNPALLKNPTKWQLFRSKTGDYSNYVRANRDFILPGSENSQSLREPRLPEYWYRTTGSRPSGNSPHVYPRIDIPALSDESAIVIYGSTVSVAIGGTYACGGFLVCTALGAGVGFIGGIIGVGATNAENNYTYPVYIGPTPYNLTGGHPTY